MFLDGAKLHQPGRILLPVSSSRTGRPIARSAEELSSTWPSPADITVDLDHRPNWTERIVALRLRPTVGDLSLRRASCSAASVHGSPRCSNPRRIKLTRHSRTSAGSVIVRPAVGMTVLVVGWASLAVVVAVTTAARGSH